MSELSVAQREALAADAVYREPIGSDEILLVGDIAFGAPVLREFYDNGGSMEAVESAIRREEPSTASFLKWASGDVMTAMKTLFEVQKIRDLLQSDSVPCCTSPCSKTG